MDVGLGSIRRTESISVVLADSLISETHHWNGVVTLRDGAVLKKNPANV
jgi:hypothetical protein